MQYPNGLRLAKWIAQSGYCSRRAAARLIKENRVWLNDQPACHTNRVCNTDTIRIDDSVLGNLPAQTYLLYHKPVGINCNNRPDDPASLYQLLKTLPQRLFAVGRLDKDSSGLLLLTNDGELCQRLLHPDYYHNKTYLVATDNAITADFIRQMATGVSWQLGQNYYQSRPCQVKQIGPQQFEIVLTQGLHRQIRYMCKALGYRVSTLTRTAIGAVPLADLAVGQYRTLHANETPALYDENITNNTHFSEMTTRPP